MKLAPSQENVDFLRDVSRGLMQVSEQAVQSAQTFASQVSGCLHELTEGDAEAMGEIIQGLAADARGLSDVAIELSTEANKLSDELEEAVRQKVLRR